MFIGSLFLDKCIIDVSQVSQNISQYCGDGDSVTDVSDNISQTISLWDNWQGKIQRIYFHTLEFVLVFPSYLIHYDIKAIYIASCPIG